MKKVFCMVLAFALVMCLFAGCGKDAGTEGGTALKIGTIGPLTGDAAQYGNATKNGAELAAKEINAKGGIQIEIQAQDDENDTEKSVNAWLNLIYFIYSAVLIFSTVPGMSRRSVLWDVYASSA